VFVVVVDTATPAVTAGVARIDDNGVQVLAQQRTVDARAHGELLAPAIVAVLAEAAVRPGDLGAVVAGIGPGPFTGLRIGMVTAAALAQALEIPTYGVCSLDAIGALTAGTTLVATDARRKEIYWAVYEDGVRRGDPAVNRPRDVTAVLAERGIAPAVAAGDGALRYAQEMTGSNMTVADEPRYPSPAALAGLAAGRVRAGTPPEELTPLYLRRPDAVEPAALKPVKQ
jgi:tRNA threonylcarbamoyl adenosine modification protein YeaZ